MLERLSAKGWSCRFPSYFEKVVQVLEPDHTGCSALDPAGGCAWSLPFPWHCFNTAARASHRGWPGG